MSHKLLIADDSDVNLTIMLDILSDAGYEVFTAQNGKIAVKQAVDLLPDIILMDWQMPVMNGIVALEKLKKDVITIGVSTIVFIVAYY